MLKLLSRLFREKPPAIELAQDGGLARMSRMRRKTDEMAALVESMQDDDDPVEQNDQRKDILSKARDMEIGTSYKGYTSRAKDEHERRSGSLIRDWHERISHLPGFEVDPQC